MDEGKIIFKLTKFGEQANSRWKVYLDGRYVGVVDFNNTLQVTTSKGKHKVKYKHGSQSTRELDVDITDEDTAVECVFGGFIRNFHVIGSTEENSAINDVVEPAAENTNNVAISQNQIVETSKSNGVGIFNIILVAIIMISLSSVLIANIKMGAGNKFKDGTSISQDAITEAEKEVKKLIAEKYDGVPDVTSEIIAEGDEWAIVLTRYKIESVVMEGATYSVDYSGSCMVGIEVTSYSCYPMYPIRNNVNYDWEPTDSEIELLKAELEFY